MSKTNLPSTDSWIFANKVDTLAAQKEEIHSLVPNLFTNVGIEIEEDLRHIAQKLRLLAVAKWTHHTE